ncbi:MAG: hypothetical protein WCD25_14220 [Pseudolabrys sp.]
MSKGLQIFKQTDLLRAIKTFQKAGLPVARAEIDRDGKIVVVTGEERAKSEADELDRWLTNRKTNHARQSKGH